MTEKELKSFKNIVKYDLDCIVSQRKIDDCKQRVQFAENPEEIQVAVLDILRELKGLKDRLKEDFENKGVKLLEPKETTDEAQVSD